MKRTKREHMTALTCVLPVMAYFLILTIPPIVMLFYYSFTDLKITLGTEQWVGLLNYQKIFTYPEYLKSLETTFLMAVFLMVFGLLTGFGVALLLNSVRRFRVFFRTLWYIPVLLAMPVIAKLISFMLWENGALNTVLRALGGSGIHWYESTFWMYFWIVFLVVWKNIGSSAILFIAGLNAISPEIYEAARMDGAGRLQNLWYITLPLIRPIMGFVVINGVIGALGTFEPVQLISGGAPGDSTMTILFRIYNEAFSNFKQGFASALSVVVFFVTVLCTLISMKVTDSSLITGKSGEA